MQVSLTATNGLERRLEVAVPATEVTSEVEQRLKNISRTARLKGFRPARGTRARLTPGPFSCATWHEAVPTRAHFPANLRPCPKPRHRTMLMGRKPEIWGGFRPINDRLMWKWGESQANNSGSCPANNSRTLG